MKAPDLHVVAVHLNATGGGKRWYRSVPRSLSEAHAEHAELTRQGYESRVDRATKRDLEVVLGAHRDRRLRRAKARTRQLDLFGDS